ncbi:hypothetical protein KIL84_018607 [Mauremys mutica]|uniref:Uncharacterized protein n=1 Tax=Mauremys mutica TaxID=74926 RepID=A0A9D3XUZ7_9SAUR|nr:hypothetical protein KIL84_018607 [Mauremys mutica]
MLAALMSSDGLTDAIQRLCLLPVSGFCHEPSPFPGHSAQPGQGSTNIANPPEHTAPFSLQGVELPHRGMTPELPPGGRLARPWAEPLAGPGGGKEPLPP